jgi:signal transduction histidine kinase
LITVDGPIGDTHRHMGIVSAVASPIIVEGRLWGAMAVHGRELLPPDTEERVEKFTELVATAIANAEGRATLTELAEEQATLRRVATLVARGVKPDELFAAVSDELVRLFGTDTATVVKYDDEGTGIVFVGVASRVSDAFPLGAHWPFQEGMASAEVYRTGRSARTGAHLSTVEGPIGDIQRGLGIMSAVASPIVVEGRLWGAMAVQSKEPLPPDTGQRVEKFTELVATAIANAESREALAMLAEEQAALRRVATLVASGVRADEIFAAVSDEVAGLVGTDSATVMKYDDDLPGIVFVGTASKMSDAFPLGARWRFEDRMSSAEVYRTGRSARSDNQNWSDVEGPVGDTHRQLGIVSTVASPIVVEGRLWGAIAVQSQGSLPPDTEERLEKFTGLVATAIANAESVEAVARLAEEQAALREVATLVARGTRPEELFTAVVEEAGRVLPVQNVAMARYESDRTMTVLAISNSLADAFPVGSRWPLGGKNVSTVVLETGRSARLDNYADAPGRLSAAIRERALSSAVGAPIVVEGHVWGLMTLASTDQPLPADTETRLASFTELVATAIANSEARTEVAASRARIVAATDDERRRVVRDLHDGAQQRLVHTVITLKLAQRALQNEEAKLPDFLTEALDHAEQATTELRELAHGILPAVLTQGGLRAGVNALASRMPVPVEADVSVARLPPAIEATAYFVVAEALTNVAKHARAGHAEVTALIDDGTVRVRVRDDGVGGARPDGSGLTGLADRLAVLDGNLWVESPVDGGTLVAADIPIPPD